MLASIKKLFRDLSQDESAQGAAEYVLLLVVVVALVIIFKGKIREAFSGKVDQLSKDITDFKGE